MQAGLALAGRYVLDELLGQGAVGQVWRAKDRELGRAVAVKVIRERVEDPKLAAGLLGEARIAGRLQHPGITVVHDAGEHDGQPFVVMELLHGRDLDAVLAEWPGGMPADQAVSLVVQVAEALAAAHAGGVVHRDLKPANLFLQDGGQLKICDFGIAVAADIAAPDSASYVVGTPAYMSPEQCDGQEAGEPADLYSLGCVLYALLTGRPPFTGRPPMAIMAQHRTAVPPGPRALRPAVPAELDRLVTDLLAKDPEARPDSAAQVAAALRALCWPGGQPPEPPPGWPGGQPPEPPPGWPEAPGGGERPSSSGRDATPDATPRVTDRATDRADIATDPAGGPTAGPAGVSSRQLLATASSNRTALLWDPVTRQPVAALAGHKRRISAACPVTVDGRQLLATVSSDRTARLWDPATGEQVAMIRVHQGWTKTVCAVTVGGRPLLATGHVSGAVWLWDLVTGHQAAVMRGHEYTVDDMCPVTADGRQLLATISNNRTARLWDPATGQQVAVIDGGDDWVCAVCAVTVGGRPLLATGGRDGTVRLWDPATGQQAGVMQAHLPAPAWPYRAITGICAVTVGGRPFLAAGGENGEACLLDLATGQQSAEMRWDPGWSKSDHRSVIRICAVTADGRSLLATGHVTGVVRLWDPATGQLVGVLRGHDNRVNSVCAVTITEAAPGT